MPDETTKPAPRGRGAKAAEVETPVAAEASVSYIDGLTVKDDTKYRNAETEEVKAKLEAQPKEAFYIPLSPGESPLSRETVIINGFQLSIAKNISVLLPKQVADMLRSLYNIESNLGNGMVGANSGKPIRLDQGQTPEALA